MALRLESVTSGPWASSRDPTFGGGRPTSGFRPSADLTDPLCLLAPKIVESRLQRLPLCGIGGPQDRQPQLDSRNLGAEAIVGVRMRLVATRACPTDAVLAGYERRAGRAAAAAGGGHELGRPRD